MSVYSGKVALVFGGSRGIGAAIVERLVREGYAVAFTYISSEAAAHEIEKAVIALGGRAKAIKADSGKADDIRWAVSVAIQSFGKLNAVVVNAGVFKVATIDAVTEADLDEMLRINVRGVYLSIQAAAAQLNDGGRVVTIGSNVAIRTGCPGASVYQMTKSAVAAMVKGIALDLAPRGITVNNVQPGPTDTDINAGGIEALSAMSPLKRVAQPAEIAGLEHDDRRRIYPVNVRGGALGYAPPINYLAPITALLALPLTFAMSNDTYYFGVVPVLAQAGEAYGIPAEAIARASLMGGPVHSASPLLVPVYLACGLLGVDVADARRFVLKYAVGIGPVLTLAAILTGPQGRPHGR
ncbi:SDR family NAD(P)-dependent oxidoreductase [Sphingopyxis chilensis]